MQAILLFILTLILSVVLSFIGAIPLYYLWNWLMPELFNLKVITFWQGWGLLMLASILFKSNTTTTKD